MLSAVGLLQCMHVMSWVGAVAATDARRVDDMRLDVTSGTLVVFVGVSGPGSGTMPPTSIDEVSNRPT